MRSTRVAASLGVLALLVAAATGCGASSDEPQKDAEYVALGDSYTSGPGMVPIGDTSCRRSEINYPSLVAKALKIKDFADRSCAGARLANLVQPQTVSALHLNDPQTDALGKQTKLVTIGMGLNDRAISTGLLLICITPKAPEPSEICKKYLAQPESAINTQITAAAAELKTALQSIKTKAPQAQVVLVGYPRVAPDQGSCPDLLPVPEAQLTRLREALEFVNQTWSQVAQETGALYVDMYTPSEGHDICSDQPWVNGYLPVAGKAVGLHPFPAYEEAVAAQILQVLGNG